MILEYTKLGWIMLKTILALFFLFLTTSPIYALTNSVIADSDQWSPVVQISNDAPDANGESIPSYCNGTLIAKTVILTAAHCVKFAYLSRHTNIEIETGHYKYVTKPDGQVVRIGYVAKNKFEKNVNIELPQTLVDKFSRRGEKAQIGPDEDFAILWWNEPTPETDGINFAQITTPQEHSVINKNIKQYPLIAVSINLFAEMSLNTKRMITLDNYKWNNNYVYSKSNSRVEEGDSGAPLFVKYQNKYKLFSVVKGKASTIFDNWDVYSSINPHLCALNRHMPTDLKISGCF